MRKKRTGLQQISLSEEQKEKLREEIRAFYLDERGEEIEIIEQIQLLDLLRRSWLR